MPTRNSLLIRWFAAGVLVASLAAGTPRSLAQGPLLNKPAPPFARNSLDQQRIDINAYRGKLVLLNFWATWCGPCELEMPRFVEWQNKYASRGLQVVGISMDDSPALARDAYRKLHINYPIAMGDAKLGELYGGVLGLPVTFLIDSHGIIRARFEGITDLTRLEAQLQSLLPRP